MFISPLDYTRKVLNGFWSIFLRGVGCDPVMSCINFSDDPCSKFPKRDPGSRYSFFTHYLFTFDFFIDSHEQQHCRRRMCELSLVIHNIQLIQ